FQTIEFDKTGTITERRRKLTDIFTDNGVSETVLLQFTASAEKGSEHPLAEDIVKSEEDRGLDFKKMETLHEIAGHGNEQPVDGRTVLAGNRRLMDVRHISLNQLARVSDELADQGKTPMYIAIDDHIAGIIAVANTVKENSQKAIEKLHDMGIEVAM